MGANNIDNVTIIGAGIGGLTAAMLLSHAGVKVHVYEQHSNPGGKMRTKSSPIGPIDSGPTVLTMYEVFKNLFLSINEDITDHLNIIKEPLIARHFWPDNSSLDLFQGFEKNKQAIRNFSGSKSEKEFEKFCETAGALFESFNEPIIMSSTPDILATIRNAAKNMWKLRKVLVPHKTLFTLLKNEFSDIRLRQLFARYATYVGGSPYSTPAILALIWHVESQGVWRVEGGMQKLAYALENLAKKYGAVFKYNTKIQSISSKNKIVTGVTTSKGEEISCSKLIFNGDPLALQIGVLGPLMGTTITKKSVLPRSLSAYVWSFASLVEGVELKHHNVFFNKDYSSEFADIKAGKMPTDPTLYVCAQDRGENIALKSSLEKFEIIMNAPPIEGQKPQPKAKEFSSCLKTTFSTLENMGLFFKNKPTKEMLTTPEQFSQLFPGSNGSLYGRSPEGITSTFKRSTARSKMKGFYLTGGGVHPGAGIPMAALSGKHVAEAILLDLNLT